MFERTRAVLVPQSTHVLPISAAAANVSAVVLGDQLHVLAADQAGTSTEHLTLDRHGQTALVLPVLPFVVAAATAYGAELIVTVADDSELYWVVSLDVAGVELWRARIALPVPPTRSPRPVAGNSSLMLVWDSSDEDGVFTLWSASVHDGKVEPAIGRKLADVTLDLQFEHSSAGIVVARAAGLPPRLELTRLDGGSRVDDIAAAPFVALAAIDEAIVMAWPAALAGEVIAQRYGSALQPIGEPMRFADPAATKQLGRVRVYASAAGLAVVGTTFDDKAQRASATSARASGSARSFVAFEGESQALPGPIGWVDDGAWLDDSLLVLHGNSTVAVTAFAAVAR